MWRVRLAWIFGVVGAAAGALAPLVNQSSNGDGLPVVDAVSGFAVNGGIWALIGVGFGALIDKVQRRRSSHSVSAPGTGGPEGQVVPGPAGWLADPFRRFEGRYWDGDAWTNQVATKGRTYVDDPTV